MLDPSELNQRVDTLPASSRRITQHLYDGVGRVTDTFFNDGSSEHTSYDLSGRIDAETNPRGAVTNYVYNEVGWLTNVLLPDPDSGGPLAAPVWSYGYDAAGNTTSVTDPNGNVTTSVFDAGNRLVSVTDPAAGESSFAYDVAGRQIATTDQRGYTSHFGYDAAGQLIHTATPDPDGPGPLVAITADYTYDPAGNLDTVSDHLGRVDSFEYDLIGRMTRWEQPAPAVGDNRPVHVWAFGEASFTDTETGRFDSVTYTDPLGRKETTYSDALGRTRWRSEIGKGGYEVVRQSQYSEVETVYTYGSAAVRYIDSPAPVPTDSLL